MSLTAAAVETPEPAVLVITLPAPGFRSAKINRKSGLLPGGRTKRQPMREILRAVLRGWLAALAVASFASYPARAWELKNGLRSGMTMDEVRRAKPSYELIVFAPDVGKASKNVYLVENGHVLFSTVFCHDSLTSIRRNVDPDTAHRLEQEVIADHGQPTVEQEKVPAMDANGKVKPGGGVTDVTVKTWVADKATREKLEITFGSFTPPEASLGFTLPCN
jgi:hypothetical protein